MDSELRKIVKSVAQDHKIKTNVAIEIIDSLFEHTRQEIKNKKNIRIIKLGLFYYLDNYKNNYGKKEENGKVKR